jgi:hypothetical protein
MICAGPYTEYIKEYKNLSLESTNWGAFFGDPGIDGMVKLTFQSNRTGSYGLQIPIPAMGFCNYSNRPSASTWGNEFLQQLSDWVSQEEVFSISAYFSGDTHVLNCVIHWGKPNVWHKDTYITHLIKHNLTTSMCREQLSCSKKVITDVFQWSDLSLFATFYFPSDNYVTHKKPILFSLFTFHNLSVGCLNIISVGLNS